MWPFFSTKKIENKDGKHIKFVLGSKVMNEGVSLSNVGEVHILDVYFNFGRVDQVVGRGIRWCSHYQQMNENNIYPYVNVYKYVVKLKEGLIFSVPTLLLFNCVFHIILFSWCIVISAFVAKI